MKLLHTHKNLLNVFGDLSDGIITRVDEGLWWNRRLEDLFDNDVELFSRELYLEAVSKAESGQHIFEYQLFVGHKEIRLSVKTSEYNDELLLIVKELFNKSRFVNVVEDGEKRYHTIFENTFYGISIIDKFGYIDKVNSTFCEIFNHRNYEVIGSNFQDFFSKFQNKEIINQLNAFYLGSDKHYLREKKFILPNGKFIWCHVSIHWVDVDKKESLLLEVKDITKKKLMELELDRKEKQLSSLLTNMPGMVYRTNYSKGNKVQFISNGIFQLTGYKPEEFIGKSNDKLYDLIPQKYHDSIKDKVGWAIKTKSSFSITYPFVTKKGNKVWVWEQSKIMEDSFNEIILEGFVTDVTDRVLAEKALKESEKRLDLSMEGAEIGLWDLNVKKREISFNSRALSLIGHRNNSDIKSFDDFLNYIHPDDRRKYQNALDGHFRGVYNSINEEIRVKSKIGNWHWILSKGKVFNWDDEGMPINITGTFLNIDERKSHDIELMNAIVETQEKERTRFAKDLHDGIGQYLAAIKMNYNSLLYEKVDKDLVISQLNSLIETAINDLRAVSHNLMPGSVSDLGVKYAIEELLKRISSTEIGVNFKDNIGAKRYNPNIEINIYRVIQELINNTLKHAQASEISIDLIETNGALTLIYQDDGIGIKSSNKDKEGIGLKNLQSRVYSIRGSLKEKTAEGEGYIAIITIPLV